METKLTTNAKGNEYVEYKMEDDPFFFCKYGYIFSAPEHNLYLKQIGRASCRERVFDIV